MFVYKLISCGFESLCSHLSFRYRACFEQGVPWRSGNYGVWIHSETWTWHDKNIQSLLFTVLLASSPFITNIDTSIIRSSCLVVFCKKGVLTNFYKIHKKTPALESFKRSCISTEFSFIKKGDSGTCLLVNSAKFLVRPFLKNPLDGCFCLSNFHLFKNDATYIFRLSTLSA